MTTPASPAASDGRTVLPRSNLALRSLIDEMLERVRDLNRNASALSEQERARAEGELEAVMARVRSLAAQGRPDA